MFVCRDQSHKAESYNHLIKLLNYGEIRVIIPNIVMTEVFRHLNSEIDKIGTEIGNIKTKTNNLYWINNVEELEKFKEKVKHVKKGINELNDEFSRNIENYKDKSRELLKKLFQNDNAIIINETEGLVFKATQRKIHKKRPFHYNKKDKEKDSMADAIIVETLININDLMTLEADDEIFFLSRNPEDFSSDMDKFLLHKDIKVSLELNGIANRVHYRLLFTKMLLEDFTEETEHVGLIEELEAEAKQDEEMEIEENINWEIESSRQAGGLSSLSSDYETTISELDSIANLMDMFGEIRSEIVKKYESYSELYYFLDEELVKRDFDGLTGLVSNYNSQSPLIELDIQGYDDEGDITGEILWLVHYLCFEEDEYNPKDMVKFQDYFELNATLATIYDTDGVQYRLDTSGDIRPLNDNEDTIYLELYRDNVKIKKGEVRLYYGFLNFNDDGNAADGAEESIEVEIDNVVEELEYIKTKIIAFFDKKIKILTRIIEKLGIRHSPDW